MDLIIKSMCASNKKDHIHAIGHSRQCIRLVSRSCQNHCHCHHVKHDCKCMTVAANNLLYNYPILDIYNTKLSDKFCLKKGKNVSPNL